MDHTAYKKGTKECKPPTKNFGLQQKRFTEFCKLKNSVYSLVYKVGLH
nr:MAG TPA: hypothetical protein [Caudoviricetes sp.]